MKRVVKKDRKNSGTRYKEWLHANYNYKLASGEEIQQRWETINQDEPGDPGTDIPQVWRNRQGWWTLVVSVQRNTEVIIKEVDQLKVIVAEWDQLRDDVEAIKKAT